MNISNYFKPKTMIYTGKHVKTPTSIKHYAYDGQNLKINSDFKSNKDLKNYIQIVGLSNVEEIAIIKEHYNIDSLILEDVFNVNQRNKIEVVDNSLFGVFHVEYLENDYVKEDYMSLLMIENTIITFHETEPIFLKPLESLFNEHKELREKSIDYLLFQILDIITDNHLDVFDELDTAIAIFEAEILETKDVEQEDVYLVRKNMLKLKNNVTPIFEQLDKILFKNQTLFNPSNKLYYEDLKDHLQRLDGRINQSREVMRNLLDLHMNNQSTKMNKIMATLTLFSAIFIPLSFLTGFFGMNFIHFGILAYNQAVLIFSIMCFVIAVSMVLFFKKKKWF
ncbi:MAG: CorA family divalent cation transporter [Acholeplasmataceae bacterium]|nr:CorA family divalent cation transporter [Acholeplasmataceae bacterium]